MSKEGNIKIKYAKEQAWSDLKCSVCGARNWLQSRGTVLLKIPEVKQCLKVNIAENKKVRPILDKEKAASIFCKLIICQECGNVLIRGGVPLPSKKEEKE